MISKEQKKEIISMWKKYGNISQIRNETGVSRPTIRKIIEEHKTKRKWWHVKAQREDNFVRIAVRAPYSLNPKKNGSPIERLALGVEMYEFYELIQEIVKPETAEEIVDYFMREVPSMSIIYVKKSELKGNFRYIDH